MNVLFAGLTGAGKTAVTRDISLRLSIDRVSGSDLRYEMLKSSSHAGVENSRSFWLFSECALDVDRERLTTSGADSDDALDKQLLLLHETRRNVIFDVWFLPWLSTSNSFCIWLDASAETRAERVRKALGDGAQSLNVVRDSIAAKDDRSQLYGQRRYGIDIYVDRGPFDLIVETELFGSLEVCARVLTGVVASVLFGGNVNLSRSDSVQARMAFKRCPHELAASLGIRLAGKD